MYHAHAALEGLNDGPRMLYRSAHIYFLLASIINLLAGVYVKPVSNGYRKFTQSIISIIIIVAPVIFLAAFFIEPNLDKLARPYSSIALYALFGSALLLMINGFKSKVVSTNTD